MRKIEERKSFADIVAKLFFLTNNIANSNIPYRYSILEDNYGTYYFKSAFIKEYDDL